MSHHHYSGVVDWLINDPLGSIVFICGAILLAAGIIYIATHIPVDKGEIQVICMNGLIHSNYSISIEEAAQRCWP